MLYSPGTFSGGAFGPSSVIERLLGADVNLDGVPSTHVHGFLRPGQASDTTTCFSVRQVPQQWRNETALFKPINSFFVKYTEAYGIPIVGELLPHKFIIPTWRYTFTFS